jgi:hypothetical protein
MEVRVTIAYNAQMAIDAAKAIIKAQLEEKGEELHDQLDAMWSPNERNDTELSPLTFDTVVELFTPTTVPK